MNKASVTISRNSHDKVMLRVTCDTSRVLISEVELSLEDYALAVTGLSEVNGQLVRHVSESNAAKIGLKKIVEDRSIDTDENWWKLSKDEKRVYVQADLPTGYEIQNDGCSTQQNTRGKHQYSICKWVPMEGEA